MRNIVLMYHCVYRNNFKESGFQEGNACQYKVQVDDFELQVKSISEYCEKNNIDRSIIEFTFDDGGVSFLLEIAPILEKYNWRGVFFISTKYIGYDGFLTKENIKELSDRGHIIGSHSYSHPMYMDLLPYDDILEEWNRSIKELADIIDREVIIASIPFGFGSLAVIEAARKAGVKKLYTSVPQVTIENSKGMDVIGRFVMHNNSRVEDVIRIIEKPSERYYLYYKWKALKVLKSILGEKYEQVKGTFLKIKHNL